MAPTKWGIIGAGLISHDFANVLDSLSNDDHQICAIAARSKERAENFAKNFNIKQVYGTYDELAKDPNIDVVYVSVIHPAHLPVCKLMMNHGKNVLCEKPLAINVKETKQLLDLAKQNNVFFMEGMWTRFFPSHIQLKNDIAKGVLGDVLNANVLFGVPLTNDRFHIKDLGGGSVLDLGVYCVYFLQMIFQGQRPTSVKASGHLNKDQVDHSVSAVLTYPGRIARFLEKQSAILISRPTYPIEKILFKH